MTTPAVGDKLVGLDRVCWGEKDIRLLIGWAVEDRLERIEFVVGSVLIRDYLNSLLHKALLVATLESGVVLRDDEL